MFERSLSSLIKGLRSHRGRDERRYVATLMEEIKHEIRSGDMDVKAEAVLKLTYLQMLGYPPPNASFHMLEVMASPRFHLKQVGYLAASQCFNEDTDVLILATNLLKKDLRSSSPLDVAVALNGLSHIVTPDLAQHLAAEIMSLLTHTKPSIRKKALLVLYSAILHHPPTLELSLARIGEKLEDDDMGVISAAINIICELARNSLAHAKTFLVLSPQFFHLLTSSTNNWMLIKIIKLFGVLTPLEPRLVKKLVPPITQIISTTPAMSLLYECIHTMIIGGMFVGPDGDDLAATCVEKLATFLDDNDQNLKYIALLALVKLIPTHPHLVALHQEEIFEAMEDDDLSIRLRALDLVSGMAGRSNFKAIVEHQLRHIDSEQTAAKTTAIASLRDALQGSTSQQTTSTPWLTDSYRLEIVTRILDLAYRDTYSNVIDFEWYVDVLIKLAYLDIPSSAVGETIRFQMIDIASRVRGVRNHAVSKLKVVLEDESLFENSEQKEFPLLQAAAWICGEYCENVSYPPAVIPLLLRKEMLATCSKVTLSMMLHNAVKLFAWWMLDLSKKWQDDEMLPTLRQLASEVSSSLDSWRLVDDAEVQERAVEYRQLLSLLSKDLEAFTPPTPPSKEDNGQTNGTSTEWTSNNENEEEALTKGPKSLLLLSPLFFGYSLGPVAKKAQSKVIKPAALDLDAWLVDPAQEEIIDLWATTEAKKKDGQQAAIREKGKKGVMKKQQHQALREDQAEMEAAEKARLKAERLRRQQESPFYIGHNKAKKQVSAKTEPEPDIDDIPIVQLQLDGDVLQAPKQKDPPVKVEEEEKVLAEEEGPDVVVQDEKPVEEQASQEVQVVRKKVGSTKKKRKGKTVGEATLI